MHVRSLTKEFLTLRFEKCIVDTWWYLWMLLHSSHSTC